MKQKKSFVIISFIIFIFLLVPLKSLAVIADINDSGDYISHPMEEESNITPKDYFGENYHIESYKIDMTVNENNTFHIREEIDAYFNVGKHGIYRKIPLVNRIEREDGTKSYNNAQITNIESNAKFSLFNQNGYKIIQIGDPNRLLTGLNKYYIEYDYNIGKDPLKDEDELYFNLIGNEWDTQIGDLYFTIRMPKEFDETKLGFSIGTYGLSGGSFIKYEVDGKNIVGRVTRILNQGEGLNVRLSLPESYFTEEIDTTDKFSLAVLGICVLFLVISFLIWMRYGKDLKTEKKLIFNPPEKYNSAEVNFLLNGEVTSEGVISLILYLATKGYLRIILKGTVNGKEVYEIEKLKEYDGTDRCESIVFDELFGKNNISNLETVRKLAIEAKKRGQEINLKETFLKNAQESSLASKEKIKFVFSMAINKIKEVMNNDLKKDQIYEPSSKGKSKLLILMIITILFLIIIKPAVDYNANIFLALIFTSYPGILLIYIISRIMGVEIIKRKKISKEEQKFRNEFIIFITIFCVIPFSFAFAVSIHQIIPAFPENAIILLIPALIQNTIYPIIYMIGIITSIIILLFIKLLPKRTELGNEKLENVQGLQSFLVSGDKNLIKNLLIEDSNYVYNMMPYAYALGVLKEWLKRTENMDLIPPKWYSNELENKFDFQQFSKFILKMMKELSDL